jgi:hypothetical protein
MVEMVFTCPQTGLNVQHRLDSEDAPDNAFVLVDCPACTRLHLINRKTGKLLGSKP